MKGKGKITIWPVLWQLLQDVLQGDFQLINRPRLRLSMVVASSICKNSDRLQVCMRPEPSIN